MNGTEWKEPLTPAAVAFLVAGRAYCTARREAFDRAQEGTQQEADERAGKVNQLHTEVLRALLHLEPMSPRDPLRGEG